LKPEFRKAREEKTCTATGAISNAGMCHWIFDMDTSRHAFRTIAHEGQVMSQVPRYFEHSEKTPQHDPLIYSFLLFGGGVAIVPERHKANMLF
jgi:ribosomal protein S14